MNEKYAASDVTCPRCHAKLKDKRDGYYHACLCSLCGKPVTSSNLRRHQRTEACLKARMDEKDKEMNENERLPSPTDEWKPKKRAKVLKYDIEEELEEEREHNEKLLVELEEEKEKRTELVLKNKMLEREVTQLREALRTLEAALGLYQVTNHPPQSGDSS